MARFAKNLTRREMLWAWFGSLGAFGISGFLGRPVASASTLPELIQFPRDRESLTPFEKLHIPMIRMPDVVEDGANAPIIVAMDHPMEQDHYITSVQILDYHDPIIWKGTFSFTPDNGEVYLYTQLRIDSGESTVYVIAECNQHGKWVTEHSIDVAVGGC
ncbi:MAG: hypothetical protein CMH81_04775 [Nitrospiraceae bacterium]|nr:hypothetical protein [Nitrospiraceae bacterium]